MGVAGAPCPSPAMAAERRPRPAWGPESSWMRSGRGRGGSGNGGGGRWDRRGGGGGCGVRTAPGDGEAGDKQGGGEWAAGTHGDSRCWRPRLERLVISLDRAGHKSDRACLGGVPLDLGRVAGQWSNHLGRVPSRHPAITRGRGGGGWQPPACRQVSWPVVDRPTGQVDTEAGRRTACCGDAVLLAGRAGLTGDRDRIESGSHLPRHLPVARP
jgi:hypothetical protein